MIEMSKINADDLVVFGQLGALALKYQLLGTSCVEIYAEWFRRGGATFNVLYFDSAGARLENRMTDESFDLIVDALSKRTSEWRKDLRAADDSCRSVPNFFRVTTLVDGTCDISSSFDLRIEARDEAELREEMGDEEYEKALLEDQEARTRLRQEKADANIGSSPSPDPIVEATPTMSELLGYIFHEASKEAPEKWDQIVIDASVRVEKDASDTPQTFVEANYMARVGGKLGLFDISTVYGPLNAIKQLWQRMIDEGQPWTRIRMSLDAESSQVSLETDPADDSEMP